MANPNLRAQVLAVNAANECANELFEPLARALRPFVGHLVTTADGSLRQSVRSVLPDVFRSPPPGMDQIRHHNSTSGALVFSVKSFRSDHGRACYHEAYLHVGMVEDQVLTEVNAVAPRLPTDYDAESIERQRAKIIEMEVALRVEKAKLSPFSLA